MNLITFGFSEKGSPIFLNQEPYQQVGTMYLMKAGDNSIIGITLDDKLLNSAKAPAVRKLRKAKAEKASAAEPKRHGRKPKAESVEAAPKKKVKKAGKPKAKKEKVAKEVKAVVEETA